jgi:hypothetical protein
MMRSLFALLAILLLELLHANAPAQAAPAESLADSPRADWLLDGSPYRARAERSAAGGELVLENGLLRRVWRLQPNAACVALDNQMTDQSLLRSVRPEARVTVDGQAYDVGGLVGQPNHAYLTPDWLSSMTADAKALRFTRLKIDTPEPRFSWKQVRRHAPDAQWPPRGVRVRLFFELPASAEPSREMVAPFEVEVAYELYDGIPLMSKWITVHNRSDRTITVDRFRSEELAVVEHSNFVEAPAGVPIPRPDYLHVETDFAFGGFNHEQANRHAVRWDVDPLYETQVNYLKQTPCLLVCEPSEGPAQEVAAGGRFEGFRSFELLHDGTDRERQALALRRMYRTIAPWVTENPLMHHMRTADPAEVRRAIDDAAAVGFEMIILSFGSGFDVENRDPQYARQWREIADYAHEKGIELGGYSLLSSRRIGNGQDIVSPPGQQPTHGNCPALTSEWGQAYFKQLHQFFEQTGFDVLEHDGPYPGDVDITPRPPLQKGALDSRWAQWRVTRDFYVWCRERGVYLNAPDYYYLAGTNKCGMGYREVNWSLPRAQQLIHTRQNIFDGTWAKTPSMGWMFVPLSEYHGGGAAATIEPLDQHRDHYRRMLQANLAMGVQACYRGPRLFDTEATKQMVAENVAWFKKYRDILESDVVHGRRADGRDLDWTLHVNPRLAEKGMLVVFNPSPETVRKTLDVNLYYTGITDEATVAASDATPVKLRLGRDYRVRFPVEVPAGGMAWYTIR